MTARSLLFWIGAACCVIAELAILRSVLFGRAGQPGPESTGAPQANRSIEIAWSLLPAAGLLLILYLTWRAVETPRPPAADVSHSRVTFGV